MNWQAKRIVYGAVWAALGVAAWTTRAAAALVVAPKVRLSKDPGFTPLPTSVIADFTPQEADFLGYTAGGYAWTPSGQVNLGAGIIGVTGNVIPTCSGAGAPSPNTVYGWWLDDGTNVICGESFGAGNFFILANPGDYLDLQASLPYTFFQNTQ